jgi:hypothetical protein
VDAGYAELLVLHRPPSRRIEVCPACGAGTSTGPLRVEWDDGSDRIGDFTHARAHLVVRKDAATALQSRFRGFRLGAIEMPDHPNLRKPTRITKRTPKRVWLPYDGPELCELVVEREVPLLPESTVTVESMCDSCGRPTYSSFDGMEERSGTGRKLREPGKGLLFRATDLQRSDFFRAAFTGLSLCTDAAKTFIESRGFTNIEFLESGDILG